MFKTQRRKQKRRENKRTVNIESRWYFIQRFHIPLSAMKIYLVFNRFEISHGNAFEMNKQETCARTCVTNIVHIKTAIKTLIPSHHCFTFEIFFILSFYLKTLIYWILNHALHAFSLGLIIITPEINDCLINYFIQSFFHCLLSA